jgi:hypothetical protein
MSCAAGLSAPIMHAGVTATGACQLRHMTRLVVRVQHPEVLVRVDDRHQFSPLAVSAAA